MTDVEESGGLVVEHKKKSKTKKKTTHVAEIEGDAPTDTVQEVAQKDAEADKPPQEAVAENPAQHPKIVSKKAELSDSAPPLSAWQRTLKEKNELVSKSVAGSLQRHCGDLEREVRQLNLDMSRVHSAAYDVQKNVKLSDDNISKLISALKDVDEYVRPIVLRE